jgi:hypothetical protein
MDVFPTFRSAHFLHTRSHTSTSLLVGKKDSTLRVTSTRSHQEGGQSCPVSRAILSSIDAAASATFLVLYCVVTVR